VKVQHFANNVLVLVRSGDWSYGEDMTEQSHAVYVSHPPEGLLRIVNPALKFVLRTPLAGPMGKQLMVLSFTGRKSGKQYSIPVSAHLIDNQLYALAGAAWTKNFRGGRAAEVHHNGKTTKMNGELIVDSAVVSDLSHRLAEGYGVKQAQRMMGLAFREPRIPTVEEFKEAAEREGIVAVKLTPA
jgi:hypothetical protein